MVRIVIDNIDRWSMDRLSVVSLRKEMSRVLMSTLPRLLTSLPSFAFANYDKQCDISFHSYVSSSIAGHIFSAKNQANCHSNFQAGV